MDSNTTKCYNMKNGCQLPNVGVYNYKIYKKKKEKKQKRKNQLPSYRRSKKASLDNLINRPKFSSKIIHVLHLKQMCWSLPTFTYQFSVLNLPTIISTTAYNLDFTIPSGCIMFSFYPTCKSISSPQLRISKAWFTTSIEPHSYNA